jgi:AcrR family transcriptional regulator
MRKLAKQLGAEAMSLYNHIAGKDQLLDGMIDNVFSEVEPPSPGADWRQEMRTTVDGLEKRVEAGRRGE